MIHIKKKSSFIMPEYNQGYRYNSIDHMARGYGVRKGNVLFLKSLPTFLFPPPPSNLSPSPHPPHTCLYLLYYTSDQYQYDLTVQGKTYYYNLYYYNLYYYTHLPACMLLFLPVYLTSLSSNSVSYLGLNIRGSYLRVLRGMRGHIF